MDSDGRTIRDVTQWDVDRHEFTRLVDQFLVQAGSVPPEDQHTLQQRLLHLQICRFQNPSASQLVHQNGATLCNGHFAPESAWARELQAFPNQGALQAHVSSTSAQNGSTDSSTSAAATSQSAMHSTSTSANPRTGKRRKIMVTPVAAQSLPHHCLAAYNTFMCIPQFTKAIMNDGTSAAALIRLARVTPDERDGIYFLNVLNTLKSN